jgi:putative ABC transport system permease protein
MLLSDLILSSAQSIYRNASRSALTILGIVIGIAAVIVMLSIGQGAQGLILNQVADLGSDQIFVEAGSGAEESGPPNPFIEQTLRLKDVEALARRGPFAYASAMLISNSTVSNGDASFFTDIAGCDEYQLDVFPATMAKGRFFAADDVNGYGKVAVLGHTLATDLFGDNDPIGKRITVKDTNFRVIGVVSEQGSRFFSNLDKRLYIPVTTMQRDVLGVEYVSFISLRAIGDVENAKEEARYILRDTHDIRNPSGDLSKDDFRVSSQQDAADAIGVVGSALTFLLAAIAAISLVVGGIGIMNIMLVSVTERTKEIGLRKAIGGTRREVLRQFLLEAVFLTMTGGIIGVLLGVSLSFGIGVLVGKFVDGWAPTVPFSAVILSVVVSTIVGLVFGYYPAKRAAKLDPIEALRYE